MTGLTALSSTSATHPPRRQYANAPIVETVIEIRAESKQGHNLSQLKAIGTKAPQYTETRETFEFDAQIGLDEKGKASGSGHRRAMGYQFVDPVGRQIFSSRIDLFSYSKLQPYTHWEAVRDEAARLWSLYTNSLKVRRITRIGVRYVNRLDLPGPVLELKDWLLTGPEVAQGMHQQLAGFTMQLVLPQPDLRGTMAIVRQAVVAPPRPDVVSVVLDIDVHRAGDGLDLKSVWSDLELLHERENQIFECSITDRFRERIS